MTVLAKLRYNYSSVHLRYTDRARAFPEDVKLHKELVAELRATFDKAEAEGLLPLLEKDLKQLVADCEHCIAADKGF